MKIKLLLALALGAILVTLTTTAFLVRGYLAADPSPASAERSTSERVLDDLAAVVGLPLDAEGASGLLREPQEDPSLRGRVELFGACAGEQDVVVHAMSRAAGLEDFLRAQAAGEEGLVVASSSVGVTGDFQLQLPAGLERVHLLAVGSHGYQPDSALVALAPAPGRVTLTMYCGAQLFGSAQGLTQGSRPGSLGGVTVRLTSLRRGQGIGGRRLMRETQTSDDGSFSFSALPLPNDYQVEVALEEFAPIREDARDLVPGETRQMTYGFLEGGELSGRVVDPSGAPLAEAEVTAGVEGDMERSGYGERKARTDAEGRYTLRALPRERVVVRAAKPTFLESGLQHVELGEKGLAVLPDLVLEPGASIAGTARWPDGAPLVQGEVEVSFDRARQFSRFGSLDASRGAKGSALTDANGSFRISGLGKGPFSVEVRAAPGSSPSAQETEALWSARLDDVAPGSEGLELVLTPPLSVKGSVSDATGAPLQQFTVRSVLMMNTAMGSLSRAERDEEFELDPADGAGAFELQGLSPGTWTFYVSAEGFATSEGVTLELPAEPAARLSFALRRASSVSGIVRSPLGAPIGGARVSVDLEGPGWRPDNSGAPRMPTALSAEDGSFQLSGLMPGSLRLVAVAEDYCPSAPTPFELKEGETLDSVQLRLREGAQLTGDVLGREDRPVPRALVQLVSSPDFDVRLTRCDEFGRFELQHLEPGTWQVIAMPDRERLQSLASDAGNTASAVLGEMQVTVVELLEGGARHVRLGGEPIDPLRLRGRVLSGGRPVSDAIINVSKEGTRVHERSHRASSDEQGEYSLLLDGSGRYTLSLVRSLSGPMEESLVEFQLDLPRAEEVYQDLVLPSGSIRGAVLRADGTPASHQRITLAPLGPRLTSSRHGPHYTQTRTDADGSFHIDGVPAGRYLLGAAGMDSGGLFDRSAALGRELREVELSEGEELELPPIVASPPFSVRVQVRDETGRPVSGAAIFARSESGLLLEHVAMTMSDAEGRCEYHGLTPGKYRFSARKQDLASLESELVQVGEPGSPEVELELLGGTLLWIQLRDESNQPLDGTVQLFDSDGRELHALRSLAELLRGAGDHPYQPSELVLGPLPPGSYRIEARSGELRDQRPLVLTGRAERKLQLRLR